MRSSKPVHWVTTWTAPPDSVGPALPAQTIRQVVRTSIGGSSIRLRLSNLFGSAPLTIGSTCVAARAHGPSIKPDTSQAITFNGKSTVTISSGSEALSDAIAYPVRALEELVVSIYLPFGAASSTTHILGLQTGFRVLNADHSATVELPHCETCTSRFFLTDLEVAAHSSACALVALGDSLTDGYGSTHEQNLRWPDLLAQRLQSTPALASIAVLNSGISANRILDDGVPPFGGGPNLLDRFDRDALSKTAVRWVLLFAGVNDIMTHASVAKIIDAMKNLIERARAKGVSVWGATLIPFGTFPMAPVGAEATRQAVNAWIRSSAAFTAVADFDLAIRDPACPANILPGYDSGDHLHLSDAGYQAIARSIDLGLFSRR